MKRNFKNSFNYMPETYNYPKDKNIILKKFNNYSLSVENLWLVKPPHLGGGKGISILESLKNIKEEEFLIIKNMIYEYML